MAANMEQQHVNLTVFLFSTSTPMELEVGTTSSTTGMLPVPEKSLDSEPAYSTILSKWYASTTGNSRALDDLVTSEAAQRVIDRLQLELDSESDSLKYQQLLGLLHHLSDRFQILPSPLTIQVRREGSNPVTGGGYADIWRGLWNERPVCLKVLRFFIEQDERARAQMRKQFCREALVWRQLKHPNILSLLGINTELFSPSLCLVSPWMKNRDVITYLKQNQNHNLLSVLQDVAAGICYLHSSEPSVVHRDIRGGNILVTDEKRCCLADFGLSVVSTLSQTWSITSSTSIKGTMRWLAPEYIDSTGPVPNHTSRDVYAFGCTIIEIITQKPPFSEHTNEVAVLRDLLSGARPTRPENVWCPDEIWDLATRCWAQNIRDRPPANEINNTLAGLGVAVFTEKSRIMDIVPAQGGENRGHGVETDDEHGGENEERGVETGEEQGVETDGEHAGENEEHGGEAKGYDRESDERGGDTNELGVETNDEHGVETDEEHGVETDGEHAGENEEHGGENEEHGGETNEEIGGETNKEHDGETEKEYSGGTEEETIFRAVRQFVNEHRALLITGAVITVTVVGVGGALVVLDVSAMTALSVIRAAFAAGTTVLPVIRTALAAGKTALPFIRAALAAGMTAKAPGVITIQV
ncbi:hypothetical protein GYMLUDRAFT_825171 [Collybiopsis luxurians FD-317 M1]|uniref:Unplaced genomic scaffold GYMLUscaffold_52, whole genome shotgun sequence n=1 Tax=Collybiopsis luxurians FD-317 M1 TaxID=944289 RepID=A0A0D0AZI4_9AGAR|nr:hypothetical protein GYMLUDRAFT_825171 [Collybiopsis luxurians FD-317 M1]